MEGHVLTKDMYLSWCTLLFVSFQSHSLLTWFPIRVCLIKRRKRLDFLSAGEDLELNIPSELFMT